MGTYLIEFGVENSDENQYRQTEYGECSEGDIPVNPQVCPGDQVSIDVEKPHTAGYEKYQPQYRKEY
jgi:hypothetical protein